MALSLEQWTTSVPTKSYTERLDRIMGNPCAEGVLIHRVAPIGEMALNWMFWYGLV